MKSPSHEKARSARCVLILTTTHWVSTARLVMALDDLGCRVELVAPSGHPALQTGKVAAHYAYRPLLPLTALRRTIEASRPDLVLLCDELSFLLVEELAHWASVTGTAEAQWILRLLTRSFGSTDCLPLTRSRIALLSLAEAAGVAIPVSYPLRDRHDLQRVAKEMPKPWILKADATWGGFGVRSASHITALGPTWKGLQRPLNLLQSLKRGWQSQEWGHLRIWLRGDKRDVLVQQYVHGKQRTGMAVCHAGEVKASVCFEVEEARYVHGPSSMVRVVEDEAIVDSMQRVVGALGLTGFCGFDFIVESITKERRLLEMNMRPTTLGHLSLGLEKDLCAALVRNVLGCEGVNDRRAATDASVIALFPEELLRDPAGLRLGEGFHDVPWASPALVEQALLPHKLPAMLTADPRWRGEDLSMHPAAGLAEFSSHGI